MLERNFIITELRVLTNCDNLYKKVLRAERFRFNSIDWADVENEIPIEASIFGKRVLIQTIVGMNGSGKSSLMELLYRMINNFSFYIVNLVQAHRVAAEPIHLIKNIYADLDFIIDGYNCSLMIRDTSVAYKKGEKKIFFGDFHDDFHGFEDFNNAVKETIVDIASSFFYTIVTNYSFQSLICKDFANDLLGGSTSVNERHKPLNNGNWLDSLFRKNDGYITPIVLNPYREDGSLDLNKEYYLTTSRISTLLINSQKSSKHLLEGYELATIDYTLNTAHFLSKISFSKKSGIYIPEEPIKELLNDFKNSESLFSYIISKYPIPIPARKSRSNIYPYTYLVYKTITVLNKYDQYSDLDGIPNFYEVGRNIQDFNKESISSGIQHILNNRSHVNNKIHQTINFIKHYSTTPNKIELNKYEPYKKLKKHNDLEEIITHLPPPFYSQNIKLYKNGDKTTHILISSLSSGERQFIYNISTIIYHIKNLLSIQQKNRIRYRNVNLILDEVEICFHPEFQRQFISRFLELFDRLNLTRNCSFNIIIITHSPFVLSDIPKKNILYLQDGHQYYDEQLINPFAANINDILYQSFFLNGGFIGENSKNVISSALSALKRKNRNQKISESSIWNQRTLYQLVGIIGEPLIRENLLDLINEAFSNATYEDILKEKETEIEELKHILKQLQNKD